MGVATALAAGLHWCSAEHLLFMGGCYSINAAPGSGVCREARDGVCVGYAEETTRSVETIETCIVGTETGKCAPDHCNVQIGDSVYCSQCNDSGADAAPTNGVCSADNNECSAKADGRCTTCDRESFMLQGMIYSTHRLLPVLCCWAPRLRGGPKSHE